MGWHHQLFQAVICLWLLLQILSTLLFSAIVHVRLSKKQVLKKRVWHQHFYGLVLFCVAIEKSIKNLVSKLKKAYVVPKRGRPFKTPVTSESCWRARVGDETWLILLSGHLTGLVSSLASHWPPNICRLQTCSPTLRQAVNEYRRPLQGLCTSSSISQVIGCLYLSKAFLVESKL